MSVVVAAVDIGASGGRVMRGMIDGDCVTLEPVHRFDNGVVERDGHLRWDLAELERHVRLGLERVPEAASIGIDTWGVDYGVLDDDGDLLADPIAYRDGRTAAVIDDVHAAISPDELYAITGIQHLPFNTIYQLAAERSGPLWNRAAQVALLPDLLALRLTGELRTELTNASTTALLDARTQQWSSTILDRLDISADLLPPIERPGTVRGTYRDTPVVSVGSHDTASAIAGIPMATDRAAYVASGTWSLVGVVVDEPVLTDAAHTANFTNEVAVDGSIRFLRNVGGLWLLQECMRTWGRDDLDALLAEAAALPIDGPRIDVDDESWIAPGDMPARIATAAGLSTMAAAETTRCIVDSLADVHATTVGQAVELTGRPVDVVHVVGGGAQNRLLCQLTADATGLPVLAGPVEATALGNVLVQGRALGCAPSPPPPLRRYEPS
ncbi:MAG: rhamnulokinase [Actinomycetota bacterium]